MMNSRSKLIGHTFLFITILYLSGCDKDNGDIPIPAPEVLSITPESGAKGTEVVISGTNFSGALSENKVTFNNVDAEVTSATTTKLTVKVPAGAGSGEVAVTTNNKAATKKPGFNYEWLVSTVAGSTAGFANGSGAQAKFSALTGIAIDAQNNIYVADAGSNALIRKISAGTVSTLAGSTLGFKDGIGADALLNAPLAIDIDAQDNIYVADAANFRIRKITKEGAVTTLAGSTNGYEDNVGTSAKFGLMWGLCIDASGNVYVTDATNDNIRKITSNGTVTTVAGSGEGFQDGAAATAKFKDPMGIAVDANGNLYVADAGNFRIRKISNGVVSTVAGSSLGYVDGPVASALLGGVAGLCLDAQGNIYITDTSNHLIRMISTAGVVSTLAGSTQLGMTSGFADGSASKAQFTYPRDLAIDAAGNLYVTDNGNYKVRKVEY